MAAVTTTGTAPVRARSASARCGPVPSRRRSLGLSSPGGRAVGDERGAVAAELVIATPLLLLLIMGVIQFALWQHATHVAQAAAQQALSVGRLQGETPAAGEAQGDAVLAQVGAGVLTDPMVTATKTAAVTTVVVTGRATSVVGLFSLPVRAVASGPSEVLTAPGQGP
jgi:Flp pilus assembly protein TadG